MSIAPEDPGCPRVLTPRRAAPADSVRPTRAEVSLEHLRHNLQVLAKVARVPVWSVLKADAYGHGAKAVARTLERAGAVGMCVALIEEGIELREAGIRAPILVMGGHYGSAWAELLEHRLTPVISRPDQLASLAREVRFSRAGRVGVHVKVDTGMARLGIPVSEVAPFAETLRAQPELELEGLMTHFACAESSAESVTEQLERFARAEQIFGAHGLTPRHRHAANTAATLAHPLSRLDLVRPGIGLFGLAPGLGADTALKPVMRVRTEVVALRRLPPGAGVGYGATWTAARESHIATIAMGYGDGLPRALSNRGHVLVRGRRAPIVGAVSMDMTSIDVTDHPGAAVGDEVVVLGSQRGPLGEDRLGAEEIAARAGTIAWEILTGISRRVPRFYREH